MIPAHRRTWYEEGLSFGGSRNPATGEQSRQQLEIGVREYRTKPDGACFRPDSGIYKVHVAFVTEVVLFRKLGKNRSPITPNFRAHFLTREAQVRVFIDVKIEVDRVK